MTKNFGQNSENYSYNSLNFGQNLTPHDSFIMQDKQNM